ncbi:type II RES/Xre toxin-antitoxin system antitoxin [Desulfogranum mediterraneum]|uniref:type II RES/Xre toxin-antitoxin system antitoxin n=1 Tax=Desulfogranum mediterraneum TaxID=160661 RepID=UPI0013769FA3|nr:antitoxin Xre-like helix-turn-helix domain-containing protein [Desulfogranum mediterraneum]
MALPLLRERDLSIPEVIKEIENGLPVSSFTTVRKDLGLTDKELAQIIRIPKSTLAARKKKGRLSFEESERLYRIERLLNKAVHVFGDLDMAGKWLKQKAYGLGDIPPLEFARTEIGAREVERLLGRIEHGVFS